MLLAHYPGFVGIPIVRALPRLCLYTEDSVLVACTVLIVILFVMTPVFDACLLGSEIVVGRSLDLRK